jgi:hypothetical protein
VDRRLLKVKGGFTYQILALAAPQKGGRFVDRATELSEGEVY